MPGHLIRRLQQISAALFTERMGRAGLTLTPVQFAVLYAVGENEGVDQSTLAGLVAQDRATLGDVIERLEARGLVARSPSPRDRRAKALALTAEGRALVAAALPEVEAVQDAILDGLDAGERAEFLRLLNKLTLAGNEKSRAPLRMPESG